MIRAYNSTWGDKIEWDGSDYNATFRFAIDPTWKTEDLKAVAFVNNYDPDNKGNNKIDNAEACGISGDNNSVDSITDEGSICIYYDLSGRPASANSKGFLVKVKRDAYGNVTTSKVINR